MHPHNRFFLFLVFLIITIGASDISALDFGLGGSTDSAIATPLSSQSSFAWFSFEPIATLGGAGYGGALSWDIKIAPLAQGKTAPAEVTLLPGESRIRMAFGNGMSISAGWMKDEARAAELFPQTVFYGPADPLSRFETGGGTTDRETEPLIMASISGDWWRASATLAPWAPSLVLPNLDSPWFPPTLVPSSIVIAGQTYNLGDLSYDSTTDASPTWTVDPSWSLSAGLSLGSLDLDAWYFDGLERDATIYGNAILGTGVGYSFAVSLVPERSHVRKVAAAATWVADSFRVWGESSWTWGASFATGSVGSTFLNPGSYFQPGSSLLLTQTAPVVPVDKMGATFGASFSPDLGTLVLTAFLEGTANWYFGAPTWSKSPFLSKAIGGALSIADQAGRLEADLGGIFSIDDLSYALRPALRLGFGGDRDLEFAYPLFEGNAGSEFGQFASMRYITATFTQRF